MRPLDGYISETETGHLLVYLRDPRPIYPQGKRPWCPLDRRLGGPQSHPGRGGEEKDSKPPPGIEPRTQYSWGTGKRMVGADLMESKRAKLGIVLVTEY
jgi:hypothetical protein